MGAADENVVGDNKTGDNWTKISFQHFLNCLDGIANYDGVIATSDSDACTRSLRNGFSNVAG